MSIMQSWDCGGAHPNFGNHTLYWDIAAGHEIALGNLLELGGKPDGEPDRDQYETLVLKIFNQRYPEMMIYNPDNCDYTDASVWSTYDWNVREDDLYIGAYSMRVVRGCDAPEWSVLPWEDIRHLLKKPYQGKY